MTIGLGDTPNGPSAAYAKLHARSFGKEGDQADNYYFINQGGRRLMFQDTLTSLVCPYWTGNEGREIGLIF